MNSLRSSLSPTSFFWQKEALLEFYVPMLDIPLDTVYLGETVCSHCQKMRLADWFGLAEDLVESGKEIVLSSQVLLESESDLKRLRKITEQGKFKIEANDMGAVRLAHGHSISFVAGTSLNTYNETTLDVLRKLGVFHWIVPSELSRDRVVETIKVSDGIETEPLVWGKMPLTYSSRCFTVRHYNPNRDSCELRCLDHEHGMATNTREGQPFLTINGIQIMSYGYQNLLPHYEDLSKIGVNMLRLSPQMHGMAEIIQIHRDVLDGKAVWGGIHPELERPTTGTLVDGYWCGQPGIEAVKEVYYGAV